MPPARPPPPAGRFSTSREDNRDCEQAEMRKSRVPAPFEAKSRAGTSSSAPCPVEFPLARTYRASKATALYDECLLILSANWISATKFAFHIHLSGVSSTWSKRSRTSRFTCRYSFRLRKIEENFAASNPKRESKDLWSQLSTLESHSPRSISSAAQFRRWKVDTADWKRCLLLLFTEIYDTRQCPRLSPRNALANRNSHTRVGYRVYDIAPDIEKAERKNSTKGSRSRCNADAMLKGSPASERALFLPRSR